MKYYIIAGEASGDLHASNMMKELKLQDEDAQFRFWGGDLMEAQGGKPVKHFRELAFMGFTEVVMNLRTIFRNMDFCKEDIKAYKPDAVILVDYPGFNLRVAKMVKKMGLGFKVVFYISPTVWAWHQSRVYTIKKYVNLLLCILPFEKAFYKKFDYDVAFVGHPLLDAITKGEKRTPAITSDKPIIALLPGSRKQEIRLVLPQMLSVMKYYPGYNFVIAGAPSMPASFYEQFTKGTDVKIVFNRTYDLLSQSHTALVTSGTATLETALFDIPQVVCYKGGTISYLIGKQLVTIKWISLVNLILDRQVVTELIQGDLTTIKLKEELDKVIDGPGRKQMLEDFEELKHKLGDSGASKNAATEIIQFLKK